MESHEIDMLMAGITEPRYRDLLTSVLRRLPDGWDYYRTVSVEIADTKSTRGYANALRDEESEGERVSLIEGHHEQFWVVTLYRPGLDGFSDDAARWIIAHEGSCT